MNPPLYALTPVDQVEGLEDVLLGKDRVAIIDTENKEILSRFKWGFRKGSNGKGGYAVSTCGKRMHRVIMGITDPKIIIDHKNGNGLDNRIANLRIASYSENCVNRKLSKGKFLRGVYKDTRKNYKNPFRAYLYVNGKQKSLGYFATEQEAHEVAMKARKEVYKDFCPEDIIYQSKLTQQGK